MAGGNALPTGLLDDVKNALDITWDSTDAQVSEYIRQGMYYLDNKASSALTYTEQGYPRTLLIEYVRYARSRALEVFENNFQSIILAMQGETYVQDSADDE